MVKFSAVTRIGAVEITWGLDVGRCNKVFCSSNCDLVCFYSSLVPSDIYSSSSFWSLVEASPGSAVFLITTSRFLDRRVFSALAGGGLHHYSQKDKAVA